LFFAGLCALHVIEQWIRRPLDTGVWWIDHRFLPTWMTTLAMTIAATILVAYSIRPPIDRARRTTTAAIVGVFACVALRDAARFYVLLANGTLRSAVPFPLSALVAAALGWIAWSAWRSRPTPDVSHRSWRTPAVIITIAAACAVAFPLLQMQLFGRTDYARPADAVVVLGARTYADGTPSQALADRVDTACRLYHENLAPRLILSGGPGDGRVHETEAMRQRAIAQGVAPADITLDPQGLNTAATARNTATIAHALNLRRVLIVTHPYHAPRAKIALQRAGVDALTVPARSDRTLAKLPIFMAREVAAFWVYYLPITHRF
jgi:uncharacterized SAM-binding protein YcdF (DUF218 family)